MNTQSPQRTLLRTPTAMRAAFAAALSEACNRPATAAALSEYPNLPTLGVVNDALQGTAGLRKALAWRATRKGPPQR